MKKIIILLVMTMALTSYAQKRSAKHTITVDGVCEMCKDRIEKAALNTKGVKMATWNVETHQLKVILNEKKTSIETLKKNIAQIGHDTDKFKASAEVYAKIHECCKYRELDDH